MKVTLFDPTSQDVSRYGTTTTEYVEDDWKPWETDDYEIKVDDFSFEPVLYEDVYAAEQLERVEWMESVEKKVTDNGRSGDPSSFAVIGEGGNGSYGIIKRVGADRQDESMMEDNHDVIGPVSLCWKGTQSNATEEIVDYPSSLVEFKDETGKINQVEFTDDAGDRPNLAGVSDVSPGENHAKKPADIVKDLECLLKLRPNDFLNRRIYATKRKSSCTVSTASTCSSSSDNTFVPAGCGFLTGFVKRNFDLCLEEFFDADDDNSFASDSYYSVLVCKNVNRRKINVPVRRNEVGLDEQSHVEKEIEIIAPVPIKKKNRFADNLKRISILV